MVTLLRMSICNSSPVFFDCVSSVGYEMLSPGFTISSPNDEEPEFFIFHTNKLLVPFFGDFF